MLWRRNRTALDLRGEDVCFQTFTLEESACILLLQPHWQETFPVEPDTKTSVLKIKKSRAFHDCLYHPNDPDMPAADLEHNDCFPFQSGTFWAGW